MRSFALPIAVVLLAAAPAQAGLGDWFSKNKVDQKNVVGWSERVLVTDADMNMNARIDTGALLSSINAHTVKVVPGATPEDHQRITFEILGDNNETKTLERNLIRWVKIKRKGVAGYISRPVVFLDMCIAGQNIKGEVNLANRSRFIYPLLIGRNILRKGNLLVDSGQDHTHEPVCK